MEEIPFPEGSLERVIYVGIESTLLNALQEELMRIYEITGITARAGISLRVFESEIRYLADSIRAKVYKTARYD